MLTATRTRILLAATAATALHVVDDATIGRDRGTALADHLRGACVLLALLTVAAAALLRLRGGSRALAALLTGSLAATMGALHALELGSSGSTSAAVTGVLALAAGIVLIALGAAELWTTRRGGGILRRYARRAAIAVGAVVAGWYVLFPVLFAVGITHQPRQTVTRADLGRPYEDMRIRTADGLTLRGWYVPSRNGAAVIAFPGRRGPVRQARMLVRHGYGVLLVDMRGTGQSEGDSNAFGWGAARDIEAAVDFLAHRPDVRDGAIGGIGLSVGGELMLEAAAGDTRLAAVVSDGAGYRTLAEQSKLYGFSKRLELVQGAVLFGALRAIAPAPPPKPLYELVPRIAPRPVLLIEAGHGQGGEELSTLYYHRAGQPKALWRIPEAQHTDGITTRPAEYERRVVGFFDRRLLGQRTSR